MIVESSPGRWQCYFRLTEPVAPQEGEWLNRRLAIAMDTDRSDWDLTPLLCVPGTPNHKYEDRPLVNVLASNDLTYSPKNLAVLLPDAPATTQDQHQREEAARATDSDIPPVILTQTELEIWNRGGPKKTGAGQLDRSASLVQLARTLYDAGVESHVIVAALAKRDASFGWRKYCDRRDATERYQAIVERIDRANWDRYSRSD
ncbi:MAG: hypothetical protein ACR2PL_13925 [Dehalococcoidia bacterium]